MKKSDGHTLSRKDIRPSYKEAFVEELRGFWAAIVKGEPVVNLPEHAARDQKLLIALTRRYVESI